MNEPSWTPRAFSASIEHEAGANAAGNIWVDDTCTVTTLSRVVGEEGMSLPIWRLYVFRATGRCMTIQL